MVIASTILEIILGILFVFLGISSLLGSKKALENFNHLKLPDWFRYVTAVVQLIGGISMLAGIWNPSFAAFGGLWLAMTMATGAALHFRIKEPFSASMPAIVIGLLSLVVCFII